MGSSNVLNSGSPKVDLCFVPTVISPSTCCGSAAYTMSSYICQAQCKMLNIECNACQTELYLSYPPPRYVRRTADSQRTDTSGYVSIKSADTCVELRIAVHRRHIRCRRGFESSLRAKGKCNVDDAACDAHRAYQTRTGESSSADTLHGSHATLQLAADLRSRSHVTGSDAEPRRCRIYPIDRVQLYPADTVDDEAPMIREDRENDGSVGRDPRRRQVASVSPVAELRRGRVRMTHNDR